MNYSDIRNHNDQRLKDPGLDPKTSKSKSHLDSDPQIQFTDPTSDSDSQKVM